MDHPAPAAPITTMQVIPVTETVERVDTWAHTRDRLHNERTAALLGVALGVAFSVCFTTGVYSHFLQSPPSWFPIPAGPVWLYQVSQGTHVLTGISAIPLLLAKLWTVYPQFWRMRPPVTGLLHGIERLTLLPLVGGSIFMLATGVADITKWYPFMFAFRATHYWTAWITIGALIIHIGAKWLIIRASLGKHRTNDGPVA